MRRYDTRFLMLAFGLATMAGYVDAIGFLKFGGLFVSLMSGNSTQLAVGMILDPHMGLIAGKLIAGLVAGVAAGTVLATVSARYRKPVVLVLVGTILAIAAYMNGRLSDDWTTMTMAGWVRQTPCSNGTVKSA